MCIQRCRCTSTNRLNSALSLDLFAVSFSRFVNWNMCMCVVFSLLFNYFVSYLALTASSAFSTIHQHWNALNKNHHVWLCIFSFGFVVCCVCIYNLMRSSLDSTHYYTKLLYANVQRSRREDKIKHIRRNRPNQTYTHDMDGEKWEDDEGRPKIKEKNNNTQQLNAQHVERKYSFDCMHNA